MFRTNGQNDSANRKTQRRALMVNCFPLFFFFQIATIFSKHFRPSKNSWMGSAPTKWTLTLKKAFFRSVHSYTCCGCSACSVSPTMVSSQNYTNTTRRR